MLVNLKPTGTNYMEDFYYAGGMNAFLKEMKPFLKTNTYNIEGKSIASIIKEKSNSFTTINVIRTRKDPFEKKGGLVALFGNICPNGAILKRSAADKSLFEKTGTAYVFDDIKVMSDQIDNLKLNISKDDF